MAKIFVEVGITMKLNASDPKSMDFFKTTLNIGDIDTDLPVKDQLKAAQEHLSETFDFLFGELDRLVEEKLEERVLT